MSQDLARRAGGATMSQDQDLSLSRRAIAAGWRWQAGTVTVAGLRVTDTYAHGLPCAWTFTDGEHFAKTFNNYGIDEYREGFWNLQLPDLNDPATRGCLLAQVRERWDDPRAFTVPVWKKWRTTVHMPHSRLHCFGLTEVSSLLAALEAAPKP